MLCFKFIPALLQLPRRSAADIVREDTDWEMAAFLVDPMAPPDVGIQALFSEFDASILAAHVAIEWWMRSNERSLRRPQRGQQFLFEIQLGFWKISFQWHAWAAVLLDTFVMLIAITRNCGIIKTANQEATPIRSFEIEAPPCQRVNAWQTNEEYGA